MTKKYYLQPEIEVMEPEMEQELLAYSVTSTGLDDENLSIPENNTSGDSWNDALSRQGAWDEGE
jgi:hypothetical protein